MASGPAGGGAGQTGDQAGEAPSRLPPPTGMDARSLAMLVSGFCAVVLFAVAAIVPVPFAVMRPGPVRDVLGTSAGSPLISIKGHPTYPTKGSLDLLTVSIEGGPGSTVSLADVVRGWLDDDVTVRPERELFPANQTEKEVERQSTEEMTTSQENATAAALLELGIRVPTTLTVYGFSGKGGARGELEKSDVIETLDGQPVNDLPQLRRLLQQVPPGQAVQVGVRRDGSSRTVSVTTERGDDGRTLLGVLIDPTYHFPFDVNIKIDNIGGPSAGMMFSLGIIDKLTPGPMTGGRQIAGTGTIDVAGEVGPIGGIQQKLVGARAAGATWFLAPAGNCDEVVGHVPRGLRVVKVATLSQARAAVEAIGAGKGTAALPTCVARSGGEAPASF
ncbi:MAG: PDZ domain-containing protein [Actinomycetes bacterium]